MHAQSHTHPEGIPGSKIKGLFQVKKKTCVGCWPNSHDHSSYPCKGKELARCSIARTKLLFPLKCGSTINQTFLSSITDQTLLGRLKILIPLECSLWFHFFKRETTTPVYHSSCTVTSANEKPFLKSISSLWSLII